MTRYDLALYWSVLPLELLLCFLVYRRSLQRRLPFFAAYVTALLGGNLVLLPIYFHFGLSSAISYYAGWIVVGVDLIARCLAVGELCRYELRAYRGIWALACHALAVLGAICVGNAVYDAWGQPDRLAVYGLTIERDIGIASFIILAAMLLIRNYYGLSLEPLQKRVALGLCVLSLLDMINNTMLRDLFTGYLSAWFHTDYANLWPALRFRIQGANNWWNAMRMFSYAISLSIWCYALRKPLPAPAPNPELLSPEVYRELSPAINLWLRAFNDRMMELLKP